MRIRGRLHGDGEQGSELECDVQGHERTACLRGLGRQAPPRHFQIFTVQPDGSHVHQLTHFGDSSGAQSPDWSPDGRKIIFTRYWGDFVDGPPPANRFQLLTMNADGSAMRAVTSRGLDQEASYLPDGRILYYRGSSHVWVVANPDATHIRSTGIQGPWASLCVLANGNRLAVMRSLNVKGPP